MELSKDLLKKISETIGYEVFNPVNADDIAYILDNLTYELERLQGELNDIEADLRDNYRPISYKEQIGFNEKDFV